ncbi:ABC transporter ATP-binding protein [Microbacterium arabinogalactanolyticum]
MKDIGFVLGILWKTNRASLLASLVTIVVDGLLPFVQLILVAQLVELAADGIRESGLWLVLGLCATLGIHQLMYHLRWYFLNRLQQRLSDMGRLMVSEVASKTPPRNLDDRAFNEDLFRSAQIAHGALLEFANSALYLINAVVTLVTVVALLASYSPLGGALILLGMVPTLFLARRAGVREVAAQRAGATYDLEANYMAQLLVERDSNADLAVMEARRYVLQRLESAMQRRRMVVDRANLRTLLESAPFTIIMIGCLFAAALLMLESPGMDSAAGIAVFAGAIGSVASAVATVQTVGRIGELLPSIGELRMFLAGQVREPLAQRRKEPAASSGGHFAVEFDGVSFGYPGSRGYALSSISLVAKEGELVAVVGSNGSGKTTLMKLIAGIHEPTEGRLSIGGGTPRLGLTALVPQEFTRFRMSVRDSLCLAAQGRPFSDEELWTALEKAGGAVFVRKLPDGLDTQLGLEFGGHSLSGGQWQKLALARLFLTSSNVWVLDEPTSALDAESEASLIVTLKQRLENRTGFVVTHRLLAAKHADRVVVLEQGEIVEEGPPRQLLESPTGRFSSLMSFQIDS